jgi:hypothetical protein
MELAGPVVARVLDSQGAPVVSQLVTFHVTSGGGSAFSGASLTNADGEVRERWTLGLHTSDQQRLEARAVDNATGAVLVTATFSATPLPDVPASLQVVSGNDQAAVVGRALPLPCVAVLADQYGNPLAGQTVNWLLPTGGGSVTPVASTTDGSGHASTSWTLASSTGTQVLQAGSSDFRASFQATGLASTPTSIAISSGDNQTAVISTRVSQPPVVVVRDAAGRAVADVPVSFSIVDGGGSVTTTSATTDASGLASTGWTLGPTPGLNHLRAIATGVAGTVTFAATGTAATGVPASITKTAGDAQTTTPGTAVAVAPVVVVKDAFGTVVVGANVVFAVTSGGGTIQIATARTDAGGQASCGNWTLGSAAGVNTVSAMVAGVAPATFSARGASTSTDVKVTVPSPTAGQTVGEAMAVVATVTSTYQIATVTASAAGTTIPLTLGTYQCSRMSTCPGWLGTISLAGQTRGTVSLVVTAKDVLGNTTNVVVSVVFDKAPVVLVSAPLDGTVARPSTNIVAACTDDDPAGCKSLTATIAGKVVATGTDSISQSVDLSASEGLSVTVVVTGVDSIGQQVTISRTVYVESSARLFVKAEVSGTVWDALGTRVLYLDTSGATPALKVQDTATGATQVLETGPDLVGTWGCYGFLTATGAIYAHGDVGARVYPYCWVFEWRDGITTKLDGLNSCQSLMVAGNWATYSTQFWGVDIPISKWRRDLVAGTSTLVSTAGDNNGFPVASNGDVVYAATGTVYRWRGTAQALGSGYGPVTDGVNVVYSRTGGTFLNDGSIETVLTTSPGSGYMAAGGNVAYGVNDIANASQVWRHGSRGEEQLTIFGSSSVIDAIAPDGAVVLTHTGRRYRATPGTALQDISSTLGRVVVRDGKFLVLLGRTVLEVVP